MKQYNLRIIYYLLKLIDCQTTSENQTGQLSIVMSVPQQLPSPKPFNVTGKPTATAQR